MSQSTPGACRCGRLRFEAKAAPLLTMACHCTGCQQMTGSAFSLSAAIPTDAFAVTQGEPVIGGIHGSPRHFFCSYCLSWSFTRPDEAMGFVNVRSPLFEGRLGRGPSARAIRARNWAGPPHRLCTAMIAGRLLTLTQI